MVLTEHMLERLAATMLHMYQHKTPANLTTLSNLNVILGMCQIDTRKIKELGLSSGKEFTHLPRLYPEGHAYDGIWVLVPSWNRLVYVEKEKNDDGMEWTAYEMGQGTLSEIEGGFIQSETSFMEQYPDLASAVPDLLKEIADGVGDGRPLDYVILPGGAGILSDVSYQAAILSQRPMKEEITCFK